MYPPKKEVTEEKALSQLAALCSRSEHCTSEMLEKMRRWNITDDAQARIMTYLTEHQYVDDERYTRAFIKDKVTYNKWGRRKVEQALWNKRIPESIYQPLLDEIEENEWQTTLLPLLKNKCRSIKADSDYERDMKLIRFALSRGYEMDIIRKCMEEII